MVHAHVIQRLNELLNTATMELRELLFLVNQESPEQSQIEIHAGRLSKLGAEAWVEARYAHLGPRGGATLTAYTRHPGGDRPNSYYGTEHCWIRAATSERVYLAPGTDPNKPPPDAAGAFPLTTS